MAYHTIYIELATAKSLNNFSPVTAKVSDSEVCCYETLMSRTVHGMLIMAFLSAHSLMNAYESHLKYFYTICWGFSVMQLEIGPS